MLTSNAARPRVQFRSKAMVRLYGHAFNHFDPLTGTVPGYFEGQFQEIADRARDILVNRSSEEIKTAYRAIIFHLTQQNYQILDEFHDFPANSIFISPASVVFEVLGLIDKVKLTTERDLPNATRAEYFAALALGLIGHASALVSDIGNYSRYEPSEIELNRQREAAELAISAAEAATIAAMLQKGFPVIPVSTQMKLSGEVIWRETKRNTRQQTREAANKKHQNSKYAPLKARVLVLYKDLILEIPSIENAKAARIIWSQLAKNEQEILNTEEPERTLEKWIGQFKKQLQTSK